MKKATREFYAGMSIQQAYLQLVDEAVSCNEHVYTEINGKNVSSKMSLDDVMKMFGGDGLEEYAKKLQEAKEDYERRENEWKEKVEREIDDYKKEARPYARLCVEDFDNVVFTRFHDIYHGMELKCALEIVKLWNETNGDLEACRKLFYDQGHSGHSAYLCAELIDYMFVEELGKKIIE